MAVLTGYGLAISPQPGSFRRPRKQSMVQGMLQQSVRGEIAESKHSILVDSEEETLTIEDLQQLKVIVQTGLLWL